MSKKGQRERAEMIRSMSGISAAIAAKRKPTKFQRFWRGIDKPALLLTFGFVAVIVTAKVLS